MSYYSLRNKLLVKASEIDLNNEFLNGLIAKNGYSLELTISALNAIVKSDICNERSSKLKCLLKNLSEMYSNMCKEASEVEGSKGSRSKAIYNNKLALHKKYTKEKQQCLQKIDNCTRDLARLDTPYGFLDPECGGDTNELKRVIRDLNRCKTIMIEKIEILNKKLSKLGV